MASLEYRRAATQQASVVGLVIALHDTLIGNLKRAADAMDRNDIATRCDQLIHGFKVITQLEAMLDRNNGGAAAVSIERFYKHVRAQMLNAQFKLDPAILRDQVRVVMEVRQAWQQVDSAPMEARRTQPNYPSAPVEILQPIETEAHTSFSCSG
nr:flagellar export chaperone FliS [Granulicella tundricola]